MKYIDLHVHSNCSDGTCSPVELVSLARDAGLTAFALTDHDTTKGLAKAADSAARAGIELIPGIELSSEYQGKDIHILGLDIDWTSARFQKELIHFQNSRELRNEKMITNLADLGIDISWGQMEAAFGKSVWTRAHFARYLKDHGYVREMREAFAVYVGDHCPSFVSRERITPVQAVQLIRQADGIPVLAHPLLYSLSREQLQELLKNLRKEGLMALEAVYSTHTEAQKNDLRRLAGELGLAISGGSDFHGSNKPNVRLGIGKGNLRISYDILRQLREVQRNEG